MLRRFILPAGFALASLLACASPAVMAENRPAPAPLSQPVASTMSPKAMYLLRCSGCHHANGTGAVEAGVPPFPGFIGPLMSDADGRKYVTQVPGVAGAGLSNAQIAEVLNYIVLRWGGNAETQPNKFTGEEVDHLRSDRLANIVEFRRKIVARLAERGINLAEYPWP